jgi:hypothetical protein
MANSPTFKREISHLQPINLLVKTHKNIQPFVKKMYLKNIPIKISRGLKIQI